MYHALKLIMCILFYHSVAYAVPIDWNKELDDISSKLSEISTKVAVAVDKISMKVDILNEKLDGLSREVESQKSEVKNMKKSLDGASVALSSEKEEVEKLVKKFDSYGQKQLRDQQLLRDTVNAQKTQLTEMKNLTNIGFSKTFEKLTTISNKGQLISDIFEGVKKLAKVYSQQEAKLNSIKDSIETTTDSINRAKHDKAEELEQLWKNISITLKEQSKPLSSSAASHVSRAAALSTIVGKGMDSLKDLEPKLIHVARLSENMRDQLTDNNLSPIANNLTKSLKALETSTPRIISSVSKDVNSLEVVLLGLNALSNQNDCPADLTSEIRDHHNEIVQYLNRTILMRTPDQNIDEVWKEIIEKLKNIEKTSEASDSINDRLIKLRDDIGDVRKSLEKYLGESEPDNDVVFG